MRCMRKVACMRVRVCVRLLFFFLSPSFIFLIHLLFYGPLLVPCDETSVHMSKSTAAAGEQRVHACPVCTRCGLRCLHLCIFFPDEVKHVLQVVQLLQFLLSALSQGFLCSGEPVMRQLCKRGCMCVSLRVSERV